MENPMIISLDQQKAEQCLAEVKAVLRKYNCVLQPQIQFQVAAIAQAPADLNNGNHKRG